MATYTSSIPEELISKLSAVSQELKVTKSSIIQKALEIYLRELDKAAYAQDFKEIKGDKELMDIAEEGMSEYVSVVGSL